ncbi:MAG: SIS domain-containing protein [Kiritimatiellae bacterium]|nr:SIS domain-containing protein [Kiritimatiellia bacterium]
MKFINKYLAESAVITGKIKRRPLAAMIAHLARARRRRTRVYVLGIGGSAATASHFVNDLRKLAGLDACAPTDNVSELTARINDDGWENCLEGWLRAGRLRKNDVVFVFSVGGGDLEKNISANLVRALQFARKKGAVILGIVGRAGGYTAKIADACVLVPVVNPGRVTPHTESFHALLAHLIVSHPKLRSAAPKWEAETSGKT